MSQQKPALLPLDQREILAGQLKRHEGRVLDEYGQHKAYRCSAGYLTVGYGHNLDSSPIPGFDPEKQTLNEAQATRLLMADIAVAERELYAALPLARELGNVRRATLVNMVFNLGISRFLEFQRMIGWLGRQEYFRAADEMQSSKWARQVGYRATQLAEQMRYGE